VQERRFSVVIPDAAAQRATSEKVDYSYMNLIRTWWYWLLIAQR
jgi:hypothetical protein